MKTKLSVALVVASVFGLAGCTSSGTTGSVAANSVSTTNNIATASSTHAYNIQAKTIRVNRSGEVYLFRGLANVFSRGIDKMANQIRGKGIYAIDANHSNWEAYANDIIKRSRAKRGVSYPIVIVGHSLGANDGMRMANYLGQRGVKISYVALFDPTIPSKAGKNIKLVENFYLDGKRDRVVRKGAGFKGKITNIDMKGKEAGSGDKIDHFNIEKQPKLQARVLKRVLSITKRRKARNRTLAEFRS